MSIGLYQTQSLRFWTEREIELRETLIRAVSGLVQRELTDMNRAWTFFRVEAPTLLCRSELPEEYTDDDIFITNHTVSGEPLVLRAETTPGSYTYARHLIKQGRSKTPPVCIWQLGKSYRRELLDGASASKLRYNEFYQLEFQCIYSTGTMADYRARVGQSVAEFLSGFMGLETRLVPSDRVPRYAESTIDIEAKTPQGRWVEVASMSIRNDFSETERVFELAIGADRVVELCK